MILFLSIPQFSEPLTHLLSGRVFTTLINGGFSQRKRLLSNISSVGPQYLWNRQQYHFSPRLYCHLSATSRHTRLGLLSKYSKTQFYSTRPSSTKGSNMFEKPIVVAVEGNIGSGKTVMLDFFEKNVPEVEILMEPVHKWRNYNGHNLLGMMYKDPERWSFTFQSYVQLTMAESHQTKQTKPVLMRERSIFGAKYCFVENLYECKKMSKAEYDVLTGWFDWIIENQKPKIDRIIYLRTTPENCQLRIKERSRNEESSIPIEYLQDLHQLHEDWLVNKTRFSLPAPVTVLDANLPLDQMFKLYTDDQNELLTVR
ncbi:thymidine kinase 2, mitochondrial-like isoform X2 [Antedon mediterranea]|uniref:thymidine kinase 2, mitochondrial-like isoform X2 n=1 Tax=Antedon mediterranea TaxID=105859 RepID=UPI003AF9A8B8